MGGRREEVRKGEEKMGEGRKGETKEGDRGGDIAGARENTQSREMSRRWRDFVA